MTEIIWELKTVSSGHSLRSNESIVDCLKKKFRDSKIAKNMSIGKFKSMYLIKHDIVPHLKSLLEGDINKSDSHVKSFDEILNEKRRCVK